MPQHGVVQQVVGWATVAAQQAWVCICVLQAWYDYGCFCLRAGSHATAHTALQEALVLDLNHTGDTSRPGTGSNLLSTLTHSMFSNAFYKQR